MNEDLPDSWKAIIKAVAKGYKANIDTGEIFSFTGRKLSVRKVNDKEYPSMALYVDDLPKERYTVGVHKFIAYCIWGDKALDPNIEVRHLDGNKNNICKNNLALGSSSQNQMDKPKEIRIAAAKKARAAQGKIPNNAKLDVETSNKIRETLMKHKTKTNRITRGVVKTLAEQYNVSPSLISLIGKNKIWNNQ